MNRVSGSPRYLISKNFISLPWTKWIDNWFQIWAPQFLIRGPFIRLIFQNKFFILKNSKYSGKPCKIFHNNNQTYSRYSSIFFLNHFKMAKVFSLNIITGPIKFVMLPHIWTRFKLTNKPINNTQLNLDQKLDTGLATILNKKFIKIQYTIDSLDNKNTSKISLEIWIPQDSNLPIG